MNERSEQAGGSYGGEDKSEGSFHMLSPLLVTFDWRHSSGV
jgi:hypothetical protein